MKDLVSMKTLIKQIPFVEDPDKELEDLKEQKAESIKEQQMLFSQGYNAPPEDDEEEETGQQDKAKEETSKE